MVMRPPLHASRWVALWALTSGLLAAGSGFLLRSREWSPVIRALFSVVPVIPMGVYGFLVVRAIRRLDELETRVHFEGAMTGSIVSALGVMLAGLLTMGGILPPWPLSKVWPWFWIGWSLSWIGGVWWAGRRYR